MKRTVSKAAVTFLAALVLIAMFSHCLADEIRYGFTNTRIRVRKAPSTSAEIIDHLLPGRCVLIMADADEGNVHFIGITYRDATGELSTGWTAQSDGGKVYVDKLSADQYSREFGLVPGTLPPDEAGTSGGHFTIDLTKSAAPVSPTAAPAASSASKSTSISTSQTDLVRYCQQALKDIGIYYGEITGNIGQITSNSIKEFQRRNGLTATGELDDVTVELIRRAADPESYAASEPVQVQETPSVTANKTSESTQTTSASGTDLTIDSTGETVYMIQVRLKEMGYYTGNLTGHFGSKTADAVKRFQKANGLSQTGIADSETVSIILNGKSSAGTESGSTSTIAQSDTGTVYRKGDQADVIADMQTLLAALKIYSGDITGHFGSKTKDAVMTFQRRNSLTVSGELDATTIAAIRQAAESSGTSESKQTKESASASSGSQSTGSSSSGSSVYTLDWFTAKDNGVFSHLGLVRGNYATLKDLNSGKSLKVYIQSAGYHLDVEPATASDTSTFLAVYDVTSASSISYKRRPALLTTSEGYRIVCSIYGQPHGQQVITNNNYQGQFCLHFLNSKTSGSGKVDSDHQSAIQSAISMCGGSAKKIQSTSDL